MSFQSYENEKFNNTLQQFATCILFESNDFNNDIHLLDKHIDNKDFYRLLNDWVYIMNEYFTYGNKEIKDFIFNRLYKIYKIYVLKYIKDIHFCYSIYYKTLYMRVEYKKTAPFNKLQKFIYLPNSIHNNSIVCYIFEKFCEEFPLIEKGECSKCKKETKYYEDNSYIENDTNIEENIISKETNIETKENIISKETDNETIENVITNDYIYNYYLHNKYYQIKYPNYFTNFPY